MKDVEIYATELTCWDGGMTVEWSGNIGFGEVILRSENGETEIYSETMGKEFVMKVLQHVVDNAKIVE